MHPSTPQGCSDVAAWARLRTAAAPSFLIDVDAAVLVDANAAGRRAWSAQTMVLPTPLDAAMPALYTLKSAEDRFGTLELLFWTARGPLLLVCELTGGGVPGLVCVAAATPADEAARHACLTRACDAGVAGTSKLAHELRTPLGAVVAYAEVMAREHFGPIGNARYRAYAGHIFESARHALSVVDGMMAAGDAAERRGARELRFKDLDPVAIADSCLTVIRPIAERAQVVLDVAYAGGLPRIVADAVSLRQMLLNLLTNAVKFARRGDRVTLSVTCGDDGCLAFAVEDTGPGMVATRDEGHAAEAKGLGLGLPLTHELAEANGAALAIESAPGLGTRARISFGPTRVVPAW